MPAFQFTEDGKILIGYKHIDCHMIFDIKMDLTQKAQLVAGGHQMDLLKKSVYSSIVSKDSVRIILTIHIAVMPATLELVLIRVWQSE